MTKSFRFIVDEVTFQLYDDLMPCAIKKQRYIFDVFSLSLSPSTTGDAMLNLEA